MMYLFIEHDNGVIEMYPLPDNSQEENELSSALVESILSGLGVTFAPSLDESQEPDLTYCQF